MKRAAIYIRVSSERQAERISPAAQETDCKALCKRNGYQLVATYRDTEKYLAGKRQVEPSATRADRPAFKAMLAAARAGQFDVIVAWREDRLYRAFRPMLDVLDMLDETGINIELVKETFDKQVAPVKAWAARMELDAKHDRFMMGVAGRLAQGKIWNHPAPYGYQKGADGTYIEKPSEAQWIRKLFQWYSEGATYGEIRDRFVAGGAPPRRENNRRLWPVQLLCRYLKAAHYWTGVHKVKWSGTTYEIKLPALVSQEIVQRVQERQARYQQYPAGNAKHSALAAGLISCAACRTAMQVRSQRSGYKRKSDGKHSVWVAYICSSYGNLVPTPNCVKRAQVKMIDEQIWAKLWALFSEPRRLEQAIEERVKQLLITEADAEQEIARLDRELSELGIERQRVITLARKGLINEDDLSRQLFELDLQAKSLQRELTDAQLATGDQATQLLQLAEAFRSYVRAGLDAINAKPESDEQAKRQLEYRRKIVHALVKRVWVKPDKSVTLELEFDLSGTSSIDQPAACHW